MSSTPGIQPEPCSVRTSRRPGWRPNAPPNTRCHRARWENQVVSTMKTARAAGSSPRGGEAEPPWWLTGTPRSAQAAQIGSYAVEYSSGRPEPGGVPGSSRPPVRPASADRWISSTARPTSFRRIWKTPARRPGAAAQKSASQRLWARSPAQRCSNSAAVGAGAIRDAEGKKGGTVFGKTTSATMPSSSSSARRRPEFQFRSAVSARRSSYGLTYVAAQASKSSWWARSR